MFNRLIVVTLVLLSLVTTIPPAPIAVAAPATQLALAVGAIAEVRGVSPDQLNVRGEPSATASVVFALNEGQRVKLLEGPRTADNVSWWRVSLDNGSVSLGWCAATYLRAIAVGPPSSSGAVVAAVPTPPPGFPSAGAVATANPGAAALSGSLPVMTATAVAAASSATTGSASPTATPVATESGTVANAAPNSLAPGGRARVQGADDGVNLRNQPATDSQVLGVLNEGETITIDDGPRSGGGYMWWKVASTRLGLTGWSVGNWFVPAGTDTVAAPPARPSLSGPPVAANVQGRAASWISRNRAGVLVGPLAGPGFCVHMYGGDKQRIIDLVKGAGFTWVKQQVEWRWHELSPGDYNWGDLDAIVDTADANNIGVILSVVKAPHFYRAAGGDGPPDNPATLERFMREISGRYGAKVQAYEIWNEANLAVEWGFGKINAGEFVELMRAGHTGVKAGNPDAVVVLGAFTPTGVNDWALAADDVSYLRAMYAYRDGVVSRYFDALGAHPSGFNNPPDDGPGRKTKAGDNFKGHSSFYYRRAEELYQVMQENGDGAKQVWLTEFGWSSTTSPAPGYEYAAEISEEEQAVFLVRAFQKARQEYSWMGVMAVWNLNFQAVVGHDDEKWGFGVVRADYSPRPAYAALAAMPK